jgi:hypothetical protein
VFKKSKGYIFCLGVDEIKGGKLALTVSERKK